MNLEPKHVLANDSGGHNRQRILHELTQCPGLCFRELLRATGLFSGTLTYHIAVLQRRNLLSAIPHGAKILHFAETDQEDPDRVRKALLRRLDSEWRAIYDHVAANPGQRQKAILNALPCQSRSSVQHRLRRLVEMDLLETRQVGLRGVAFVPSQWVDPEETIQALPKTRAPHAIQSRSP